MKSATDIDNRNTKQMADDLEARVEVLKRRIEQLEEDNRQLRVLVRDAHLGSNRE